jgi:hypothetical protein
MNRLWNKVIHPIIENANAKYILVINSNTGITQNILDYCVDNNARMTVIDILPQFDIDKFKNRYGDKFEIYKELSLSRLPLLKDYDVILIDGDQNCLIDGDPNWYTIYNELKIIEKTFKNKKFPLILMHDVPDDIKDDSNHKNNPQRNILIDIEEFIRESELEFTLDQVNGLGILYPKDKQLKNIIHNSINSYMLDKLKKTELELNEKINHLKLSFNLINQKKSIILKMWEDKQKLKIQIDDLTSKIYEIEHKRNQSIIQHFVSRFPSLYILFKGKNTGLRNAFINIKGYKAIDDNNLFDIDYYLKNNDEVVSSGTNPKLHYIYNGFKKGSNPNPDFDGDYYLKKYKDVTKSKLNPLVHYSLFGIKEKRTTKINKVVYTAISGNYDELYTPKDVNDNWDYICFTDNDDLTSDFWEIKKMEEFNLDKVRMNRVYKILPHLFLPEYDYSLYIDGNFRITGDIEKFITRFSKTNPMMCFIHPERNSIYEEAEAVLKLGKDSEKYVRTQINKYKYEGYPKDNKLIAGGILFRNHNDPSIINLMNAWWKEIELFSYRDQLSFNYVCWKNNFQYDECDLWIWDNEYFDRKQHNNKK